MTLTMDPANSYQKAPLVEIACKTNVPFAKTFESKDYRQWLEYLMSQNRQTVEIIAFMEAVHSQKIPIQQG